MAASAYWLLFTVFMAYDDEGYVLISLKNYSEQGGLYSHVFSQYGPFFYFFHDALHQLFGYGFTNTNGRFFTLICWVISTVLPAHLVWRNTQSLALAGSTLGLTFFHLIYMVSEPIHPGGLIAALVAIGAWVGDAQIRNRSMRGLAITSGLIGTALFLIKINVGVFFFAATGAWFVVQLRELRHARLATLIVAVLLSVLPFALMHLELGEKWSRLFATVSAVASLSMLAVAWRARQSASTLRHAVAGLSAILLLGTIVVFAVCVRGTDWHDMISGVLLNPLQHPGVYHYAPSWKSGTGLVSIASLLLAIFVWNGHGRQLSWLLIGMRLMLALVFALASLEWLPFTSHSFTMSYIVPLAWIFPLSLSPETTTHDAGTRSWLGLLFVLQFLHAYPVAGSQVAWGTFLAIPLMALGLHDTQRFIAQKIKFPVTPLVGIASAMLAVTAFSRIALQGWSHYSEGRALNLPGAENLRLPVGFASALRVMALNASAYGDMLFTLPGMYSFNTWANLPSPTLANTTHWFSLLNKQQQMEIAMALGRSTRPVLIFHRGLIESLTENKFITSNPLYDYLLLNFERAFTVERYEFWVRRGQEVFPVNIAELQQLKTAQAGLPTFRLELLTAIPDGHVIASIHLVTLDDVPRTIVRWDKTNAPLISQEIHLPNAAPTGESIWAWNRRLPPLCRLTLLLDKAPAFVRSKVAVDLRGANGELLSEARFTD